MELLHGSLCQSCVIFLSLVPARHSYKLVDCSDAFLFLFLLILRCIDSWRWHLIYSCEIPCDSDCQVGEWSPWSPCMAARCINNGHQPSPPVPAAIIRVAKGIAAENRYRTNDEGHSEYISGAFIDVSCIHTTLIKMETIFFQGSTKQRTLNH